MVGKPKVGDKEKYLAKDWFEELRDIICTSFEKIELSQDQGLFQNMALENLKEKKLQGKVKTGKTVAAG